MAGLRIPEALAMIDIIPKSAETIKNFQETLNHSAQKECANSARSLIEKFNKMARKEVPDNLRSSTHLNQTLSHAAQERTEIKRLVGNSTISRNKIQAWAAVENANKNNYVVGRLDGVGQSLCGNARDMANSMEIVANNAGAAAGSFNRVAESSEQIVKELHGIHVIGNSLVDSVNYYGRFMVLASAQLAYQASKAISILTDISEHLGDHNNILASGSGGTDGFAKHVYDFVQARIDETGEEKVKKNHRFFVWHTDTTWYPAFRRLIREHPLPTTFCAKSDNLDQLCLFMQTIRNGMNDKVNGEKAVFHLLIPSWFKIQIKEPLHFPDDLQPFHVEGTKHKGKPLVELNLPSAPNGLLNGVANVTDPSGWNTAADIAGGTTAMVGGGWGVNGACLALGVGIGTVTGLGPLLIVPIWWGTFYVTAEPAMQAIHGVVHDTLCEERPRILGSNSRLDV